MSEVPSSQVGQANRIAASGDSFGRNGAKPNGLQQKTLVDTRVLDRESILGHILDNDPEVRNPNESLQNRISKRLQRRGRILRRHSSANAPESPKFDLEQESRRSIGDAPMQSEQEHGRTSQTAPENVRRMSVVIEDLELRNHAAKHHGELKRIAKMIGAKAHYQYRVIRDAFLAADADGDGRLTEEELATFSNNFDVSMSVASKFYAALEKDEHGTVDWKRFLATYTHDLKNVAANFPEPSTLNPQRPNQQKTLSGMMGKPKNLRF